MTTLGHDLLPQPKAAPRWKGLGLRFVFWMASYALAGVALIGLINLIAWK